jgi:hypothetical protein
VAQWRGEEAFSFQVVEPKQERHRHRRKYAAGDLGEDRSFHFRGPEGRLNLRAQNLVLFLQIAEGVDDETWLYHLREGHYSEWFRTAIKDDRLGEEAERVRREHGDDPAASREAIRKLIEERYTLPE